MASRSSATRSQNSTRADAFAAGLLQATSLPVIVTAASTGVAMQAIAPVTASALVAAGLLSVLVFPLPPSARSAAAESGQRRRDRPPGRPGTQSLFTDRRGRRKPDSQGT